MLDSLPAVSVVIPVRDRTDHLADAIESVRRQTHDGEIEIVVVDDGSREPIAERFAGRFPVVRWLRQDPLGVGAARRLGSERARFELLAYLDDDDLWLPSKLDTQVRFLLDHPEVDLAWSDMLFFSDDWVSNRFYGNDPRMRQVAHTAVEGDPPGLIFPAGVLIEPLIEHHPLSPDVILVRRRFLEAIGGWDRSIRGVGDCHDISVRAAARGTLGYQDAVLARARRGHDHMTRDLARSELESLEAFAEVAARYPDPLRERVHGPLTDRLAGAGWKASRRGRFDLASRAYAGAMRLGRREPRVVARWLMARVRAGRGSRPANRSDG